MINYLFSLFENPVPQTSPNSLSNSMETDDETQDKIFELLDFDTVGINVEESMGLYQSDKKEFLSILPVKISLSQEELVNAVNMRLASGAQQLVGNAVTRLFAPFENSENVRKDASFDSYLINKFMGHLRGSNKKIATIDANCGAPNNYILSLHNDNGAKKKLAAADIIFWPIHHQNHWYLLIVEKQENHFSIQCLDGFNNGNIQGECLNYGQKLVQTLITDRHGVNLTFAYKSVKIPTQTSIDDGGPVICLMAEKYCQSSMGKPRDCLGLYERYESYSSWPCDYSQVRFHIARVLFSPIEALQKGWQPVYQRQKENKPSMPRTKSENNPAALPDGAFENESESNKSRKRKSQPHLKLKHI